VVCPVPQEAERGRESVKPAKMKFCPGFHNPLASKKTLVCSRAVCISVPRKSQFSIFHKDRLEVMCNVVEKPSRMVQKYSKCGAEILKGQRPAAAMEMTSRRNVAAKQMGRSSKNNNKNHKPARQSQFMQTKHTTVSNVYCAYQG